MISVDDLNDLHELPPDDVCCCGDWMDPHPSPMECGHAPKSQLAYYLERLKNADRKTD